MRNFLIILLLIPLSSKSQLLDLKRPKPYNRVFVNTDDFGQDYLEQLEKSVRLADSDTLKLQLLNDLGYYYHTRNLSKALEFIETNPVRIVVPAVRMPRVNGDQVILRVKQMGRGIKTVIITGNMSYTKAITCYNDGADGFIQKPFNPAEIQTTFQRVLACMESWEEVFRKIAHSTVS